MYLILRKPHALFEKIHSHANGELSHTTNVSRYARNNVWVSRSCFVVSAIKVILIILLIISTLIFYESNNINNIMVMLLFVIIPQRVGLLVFLLEYVPFLTANNLIFPVSWIWRYLLQVLFYIRPRLGYNNRKFIQWQLYYCCCDNCHWHNIMYWFRVYRAYCHLTSSISDSFLVYFCLLMACYSCCIYIIDVHSLHFRQASRHHTKDDSRRRKPWHIHFIYFVYIGTGRRFYSGS